MAEKILIPEDYMAITIEDSFDLIESRTEYGILLNALYDGARLSYDKKSLRFDDSAINSVLQAINGSMYKRHLINLQKEETNGTD